MQFMICGCQILSISRMDVILVTVYQKFGEKNIFLLKLRNCIPESQLKFTKAVSTRIYVLK